MIIYKEKVKLLKNNGGKATLKYSTYRKVCAGECGGVVHGRSHGNGGNEEGWVLYITGEV